MKRSGRKRRTWLATVLIICVLAGGFSYGETPVQAAAAGGEQIAQTAMKYVGYPYVWAGESTSGFDCSGLVTYVFRQFGIMMPHGTMYFQGNGYKSYGTKISSIAKMRPGDVAYFGESTKNLSHTGIYLGYGKMVHAQNTQTGVVVSDLTTGSYYGRLFKFALRPKGMKAGVLQRKYTITYSSCGGTGSMAAQSADYGKSVKLRSNAMKRTGYAFNGWYAKRASDGFLLYTNGYGDVWLPRGTYSGYQVKVFQNQTPVKGITDVPYDRVTMCARWKSAGNSLLKITGGVYPPLAMKLGTKVNLAGKITSNYSINEVTVILKDSKGNKRKVIRVTPKARSYDLSNIRKYFDFSKLSKGTYTYTVTAKDAKAGKTLVNRKFKIS